MISVSVVVEAEVDRVWSAVQDIGSHVDWMADAVEIRFLTERSSGVGTRFECDTKVGPLRTTDVMEITAWDPGRRMGVRHAGVVTGQGEFILVPLGPTHTEFRWRETLTFPWFFGGRAGAALTQPILRRIWRANLVRLKDRIESV